ncbi:oligosaccharide flippase family protein [Candidatus Woesearchaeota archaeon]|nr:oligosaccharide flippase family protein [Candidatus Woesearchaeota archaeon]
MVLKEIFKSSALITLSNIFSAGINLVTFLMLLSGLGIYGFGLYTLSMTVISFFVLLIDQGIGTVMVSDVSKEINENNREKAAGLMKGYVALQLLAGIIIGASCIIFSQQISGYFQKNLSGIILPIGLLIIVGGLRNIYTTSFQMSSEFKSYALSFVVEALLRLTAIYAGFMFLGAKTEIVLMSIVVADMLMLALFWFRIPLQVKQLVFSAHGKLSDFTEMIKKHGKWVIVFSQARNFESNIIFWIVEYFLGVKAVGIYAALWKFLIIIRWLFEPLETIFYPLVSKLGKKSDSTNVIFRATKYMLFASVPIVLFFMLFSETAINLVLGSEFVPYAGSFRILLLAMFAFVLNIPMKPLFFGLKQQKILAFTSILLLVVSLVSGSLLVIYFGLFGLCLSRVLSFSFDVLAKWHFLQKVRGKSINAASLVIPNRYDYELLERGILEIKARKKRFTK